MRKIAFEGFIFDNEALKRKIINLLVNLFSIKENFYCNFNWMSHQKKKKVWNHYQSGSKKRCSCMERLQIKMIFCVFLWNLRVFFNEALKHFSSRAKFKLKNSDVAWMVSEQFHPSKRKRRYSLCNAYLNLNELIL